MITVLRHLQGDFVGIFTYTLWCCDAMKSLNVMLWWYLWCCSTHCISNLLRIVFSVRTMLTRGIH